MTTPPLDLDGLALLAATLRIRHGEPMPTVSAIYDASDAITQLIARVRELEEALEVSQAKEPWLELAKRNAAAEARVEALAEDKQRLDFLDECNRRLNENYGTNYGWELILNHNVNRLMLGHLQVDLNDSRGGNAKLPSCRAAIDEAMNNIRRARDTLNRKAQS
jgi:hypothetical protein